MNLRSLFRRRTGPTREELRDRIVGWLMEHPDTNARAIADGIGVLIVTTCVVLDELVETGEVTAEWTGGPTPRQRLYRLAPRPAGLTPVPAPPAPLVTAAQAAAVLAAPLPRRSLPTGARPAFRHPRPQDFDSVLGWVRANPDRNAAAIAEGTGLPVGQTLTVLGMLEDQQMITGRRVSGGTGPQRLYRRPEPGAPRETDPEPPLVLGTWRTTSRP